MCTILVFGTFDVIHPGHHWFIKKSASLGDKLIAVVSRDDFVMAKKGHQPVYNQYERIDHLLKTSLVDQAVLADKDIGSYGVLKTYSPDIICLGHDQGELKDDISAYIKRHDIRTIKIHVLPTWNRQKFSSTLMKQGFKP